MSQIPDDRAYYAAASDEYDEGECDGEDWKSCQCEKCRGIREDYADMMYERKRDEEMGL